MGRLAQDFLKEIGHEPVPVFERGEDVDHNLGVAVCVVTSPYVPIERELLGRGFKMVVPFYDLAENFRHLHPLSNGWFADHFTASDVRNICGVMTQWADDVSRAHHLQFLAWRRLREEWSFADAPIPDCARFFIPEITSILHDHETFVDAGAHHGSVSLLFIHQVRNHFKRIVAIEPDTESRTIYKDMLCWDKRIKVHPCALAQHEGIANFHGGLGYASQLSPTGHEYVITYPLDALKLTPTFVKFHLEGAEFSALKGAKHTLIIHRPIVAITVYHNSDGIWQTPLWLMENLVDYKFLFRVHSWCGTGAVIYGIPNERMR